MGLLFQLLESVPFHHPRTCTIIVFLLGFAWMVSFDCFDRPTTVEEHGFSDSFFHRFGREGMGASPHFQDLQESIVKEITLNDHITSFEDMTYRRLSEMGIPAFNLTWEYFEGTAKGRTVCAVVPSSRGGGGEALVLVMAGDWSKFGAEESGWSAALALAFTEYMRDVGWMARDILLIFADTRVSYAAGVRSFLKEYLRSSSLFPRFGELRQAVVLELATITATSTAGVYLDIEGVNGQLPNQDLVNVFAGRAQQEGLTPRPRGSWESLVRLASGASASRMHTPFLQEGIPAFTVVVALPSSSNSDKNKSTENIVGVLLAVGKALEGFFRAQSNLLQALHHSFNYYFFTTKTRHVSNGLYVYPVMFMLFPAVSWSFGCWINRDIRTLFKGLLTFLPFWVLTTVPGWLRIKGVMSTWSLVKMECSRSDSVSSSSFPIMHQLLLLYVAGALLSGGLIFSHAVAHETSRATAENQMLYDPPKKRQEEEEEDTDDKEDEDEEKQLQLAEQNARTKQTQALDDVEDLIQRPTASTWLCFKTAMRAVFLCLTIPLVIYNWSLAVLLSSVCGWAITLAEPLWCIIPRPGSTATLAINKDWKPFATLLWLMTIIIHTTTVMGRNFVRSSVTFTAAKLLDTIRPLHSVVNRMGPFRLLRFLSEVSSWNDKEPVNRTLFAQLHLLLRDEVCVGSHTFAVVWFCMVPLLLATLLVLFLPAGRFSRWDFPTRDGLRGLNRKRLLKLKMKTQTNDDDDVKNKND